MTCFTPSIICVMYFSNNYSKRFYLVWDSLQLFYCLASIEVNDYCSLSILLLIYCLFFCCWVVSYLSFFSNEEGCSFGLGLSWFAAFYLLVLSIVYLLLFYLTGKVSLNVLINSVIYLPTPVLISFLLFNIYWYSLITPSLMLNLLLCDMLLNAIDENWPPGNVLCVCWLFNIVSVESCVVNYFIID